MRILIKLKGQVPFGRDRESIDSELRLLVGSRRGLERHHTLRHAVQWSCELLGDAEKALLERCSVFAGGFDLQSACAVGGFEGLDDYAILDLLDALVRKSLLVADRSAGRPRYPIKLATPAIAEPGGCARRARMNGQRSSTAAGKVPGVPSASGGQQDRNTLCRKQQQRTTQITGLHCPNLGKHLQCCQEKLSQTASTSQDDWSAPCPINDHHPEPSQSARPLTSREG